MEPQFQRRNPDTVCDALAERFSVALSRFYLEQFGLILHHNVDKVLLRGGRARADGRLVAAPRGRIFHRPRLLRRPALRQLGARWGMVLAFFYVLSLVLGVHTSHLPRRPPSGVWPGADSALVFL